MAKSATGETMKASQTRALLFDMTFLMLVHIIQLYGLEVWQFRLTSYFESVVFSRTNLDKKAMCKWKGSQSFFCCWSASNFR